MAYLERFLGSEGLSSDIRHIGPAQIRAFILYLQQKRAFSGHPFARAQERGLSPHSINSYLRSLRAFWSWLVREGLVQQSPFARVKIPRSPRKIVSTFSDRQLEAFLKVIDISTAEGFRDYVIVLTLLDTGLRVSELSGLMLEYVWVEQGMFKVMGKGGKERLIPFGKQVHRLLWRYISCIRPQQARPSGDFLFLAAGRTAHNQKPHREEDVPLRRAGIRGIRVSPHTLRHSAAVRFLRNGGDVFSLQRLLGHATLAMTRHYCELANIDVARAHATASPVDNLNLGPNSIRLPRK